MAMELAVRLPGGRLSDDDLWEIARANPELSFERSSEGELIVSPPTGSQTGSAEANLIFQLVKWNEGKRLGVVFSSSAGFTLANGAMRSPDAAWISAERWELVPPADRGRFAHVCPEAVLELLPPSDDPWQARKKVQEFLANGASIGVLIDPFTRTAEVHRPSNDVRVCIEPRLALDPELPGFELDVSAVIDLANPPE
jgi:Uma2 family endonuclease